jgi:TolA-binding protein
MGSLREDRLMGWPGVRFRRVVAVLSPLLLSSGIAMAQMDRVDQIALQEQLARMQQQIQSLRSDLARGGGGGGASGPVAGGDYTAQLLSRVQAMDEQVRQMRGRIDEIQNQSDRRYADVQKKLDDLNFKMNFQASSGPAVPAPAPIPPPVREVAPRVDPRPEVRPEPRPEPQPRIALPAPPPVVQEPARPPGFTFTPAPEPMREPRPERQASIDPVRPVPRPEPTPPPTTREPPPPPPAASADGKRTPEMALQEGHAALARRDYATAERSAREVMANRTSPRAYDGQFLLAEALQGQRQYAQAAIAFDDTYNRSHKGRHAEDSLVGLASALTAINEKRAACDTLTRLRNEFPTVRADLKDAITKTGERAGCAR